MAGQADSDQQVVGMWLYGKAITTQHAYQGEMRRFLTFVNKPMAHITLGEVQQYITSLGNLAASSQARAINAIKSLFGFAYRIGYLPFNVLVPVQAPKFKNTLAERILPEMNVQLLIALETNPRNRAILKLLYGAGLRVSELCGLKWRDLQPRGEGDFPGQVTVFGKGGKTRTVVLTAGLWQELISLRATASLQEPVFRSRKQSGHLTPTQVRRIVKTAAQRIPVMETKLAAKVSPHWLRHAHASHSLDRGAPIHLVQATLGHASVATTGRYLHARPSDSSVRFLAI
ncbi:integrase [Neosynechococcus sphagnicola sy1]|uniref:Integrase n=1 Tax=Neosynechococcus sphagnicola sy1 TaxID=1497020 RepID=A0A098TN69_9CYAN|nr:integrase [Neosynechococcus sphagnicola sy1]